MQTLLAAKQLSAEVAKELLLLFDQDANGTIEYSEFVALSFYVNELEYLNILSLSYPLFFPLSSLLFVSYFSEVAPPLRPGRQRHHRVQRIRRSLFLC
jgi:hypothetical protein